MEEKQKKSAFFRQETIDLPELDEISNFSDTASKKCDPCEPGEFPERVEKDIIIPENTLKRSLTRESFDNENQPKQKRQRIESVENSEVSSNASDRTVTLINDATFDSNETIRNETTMELEETFFSPVDFNLGNQSEQSTSTFWTEEIQQWTDKEIPTTNENLIKEAFDHAEILANRLIFENSVPLVTDENLAASNLVE